jgi:septal ring factor EnvC (AmiA/AmiB activator)
MRCVSISVCLGTKREVTPPLLAPTLLAPQAQLAAQANETRAARDTLAEAESEMEAINFEKKQLVQQWKSSLLGMARRDEALQATEDALRKQREQEMAIDTEVEGGCSLQ